jgi:hypothetical protein
MNNKKNRYNIKLISNQKAIENNSTLKVMKVRTNFFFQIIDNTMPISAVYFWILVAALGLILT